MQQAIKRLQEWNLPEVDLDNSEMHRSTIVQTKSKTRHLQIYG